MTSRSAARLPAAWRPFVMGSLASAAFPVSALLTAPLLARGLGPAGRGELSALLTPLSIAEAISAVGTPLAAAYFVRSGFSLGSVRSAGLWIVTASGLLTTLALLLSAAPLLGAHPDLVPVFRWLALGTAINVYIELYRGIRSGQEAYGPVNANYWLSASGRLVGVVALAATGALTPTRVAVLSIAVGLLSGLTLWRRPLPSPSAAHHGPAVDRLRMLGFSVSAWAGVVSASIAGRLDQLLLIALVTPASLGVYAVAVTAAQAPMAFFPALNRICLNRAAVDAAPAGLKKAGQLGAAAAVAIVLVLAPLLPWLTTAVFGASFDDAGSLAQILLLGSAFWGVGQVLSGLLTGVGAPARASAADAIGVVVLGLGLVPLHAAWDLHGAAVAVVLGSAVPTLLKARFLAQGRPLTTVSLITPSPRALWHAVATGRTPAGDARV